ncbi:MAG: effector binding domain-containing protein [Bacteroidales bacterium]|nr:effector binding domain-containing protein [Bacteroidales bacterium]MBN2817902.1 effector binding domain-containing protein [Bacteroidales bacterium]
MKTAIIIIAALVLVIFVLYYLLIGRFIKPELKIITLEKPIDVIGLEIKTSDTDIYKDVSKVSKKFNALKAEHPIPHLKEPWQSINISNNYNEQTREFTYIVSDAVTKVDNIPEGLTHYEVPAINYAVFPIRPKSKFAWGITMGKMKSYIFREWLPASGYKPSPLIGDFELHDERSLGKHAEIQLYVGLSQ